MLIDVGIAVSNYDDLALGVRKRVSLGVANPQEAWLPLVVAATQDKFTLKRVTVRLADGKRGRMLGTSPETRRLRRASKRLRVRGIRSLGHHYVFACVQADLSGRHVPDEGGVWLVIQAEVESDDGETRRLAATTFLEVSPLPSPSGWHAGDTHMHSEQSDGHLTVDQVVCHAKNASGLSWMVLTDHAKLIRDWPDYVKECEQAQDSQDVLVCAGAEFAGHKGFEQGHALGYWLRTDMGSQLPPADESPQGIITAIQEQGPPTSFAAIAHPHTWPYDWPDWRVTGYRAVELATGGGPEPKLRTRERWFRMLRHDLEAWAGAGDTVDFVVGLASTDSHEVPLSVMPGERHLNWIHTGTPEPPADAEALFSLLRSGHCVASCGGDFGTLFVNGSGPGSVCTSHGQSPLTCEFQFQPREGHQLSRIRLHGAHGEVVDQWGAANCGSFTCDLEPPTSHTFYVAQFVFTDGCGKRWQVWANPVWVRKA